MLASSKTGGKKKEMTAFRIKGIYILLYMGYAIWKVFYNVYLDENGFSGTQIGVINALVQAMVVFIVPVWGIVADKRGIRPTLRMAVIICAVMIAFLGRVLNFWWLLAYIFFLTVFAHPLGPLTDALAVEYSKRNPKYSYGSFRLWGSFGWGLASVLGGLAFAHIGLKWIFPVSGGFFVLSIFFFTVPGK
ncbi:MAG: MFS transporter, partial [Bacteroidales bacterium]